MARRMRMRRLEQKPSPWADRLGQYDNLPPKGRLTRRASPAIARGSFPSGCDNQSNKARVCRANKAERPRLSDLGRNRRRGAREA